MACSYGLHTVPDFPYVLFDSRDLFSTVLSAASQRGRVPCQKFQNEQVGFTLCLCVTA